MKPGPQLAERQAVVDKLGECDRQVRLWTPPVNPHLADRAELQTIVDGWYADFPPEKGDIVQGKLYQLEVKPRQFERDLTSEGKALAFKAFQKLKVIGPQGKPVSFDPLSVFNATLDAIKKHLGEPFLDMIAPKSRTGRRTFVLVAKSAPAKVKAA